MTITAEGLNPASGYSARGSKPQDYEAADFRSKACGNYRHIRLNF